jgi:hypothetical protein
MDFRRKFGSCLFGAALATSVLTTGCQPPPPAQPAQAQPVQAQPVQDETVIYNKWEVETHRDHKDIAQRPAAEQKEYHDWRTQHPDHR